MKRKNNRIVALALLGVMTASAIQPASVAFAAGKQNINSEQELRVELNNLKESSVGTPYERQLRSIENTTNQLRANPETIYDLDSISARIELLVHCGKTITFATTELTNKVQKAHIEIGFEITRAVAKAANPFESVEGLKEEVAVLDKLMEKVATYPDLTPEDIATIYYKAKLDKAIWNVRINRDRNILGKKKFKTYNELNKSITKAVGVQLNPRSKCVDIDNAVEAVNSAYEIALSQE